jgi:hypothetical protein
MWITRRNWFYWAFAAVCFIPGITFMLVKPLETGTGGQLPLDTNLRQRVFQADSATHHLRVVFDKAPIVEGGQNLHIQLQTAEGRMLALQPSQITVTMAMGKHEHSTTVKVLSIGKDEGLEIRVNFTMPGTWTLCGLPLNGEKVCLDLPVVAAN